MRLSVEPKTSSAGAWASFPVAAIVLNWGDTPWQPDQGRDCRKQGFLVVPGRWVKPHVCAKITQEQIDEMISCS